MRRLVDVNRRTLLVAIAALGSRPVWAARDGCARLMGIARHQYGAHRSDALGEGAGARCLDNMFHVRDAYPWIYPLQRTDRRRGSGPTIIDTGVTREQGALLLSTAKRLAGQATKQAIATHFHTIAPEGLGPCAQPISRLRPSL